ncbi:unnamed protein product [Closterium sp. NIES-54]
MDDVYSVTYGFFGLHVPNLGPLPIASVGTCAFSVGACVVTSPGVTTAVASLSFTLDSGASQCFFCDHTIVTPLSAPVPVALADPTSGSAVARSSTTLMYPAVPSGFLTGLYIPSFSRNLVGVGYLQDRWITITFPAHKRTAICTDASTRALLATFTREPHSGLFVLHIASHQVADSGLDTASPQVAESGQVTASPPVTVSSQVAASSQVVASFSYRSLAHPTVLWHRRLGHPSIARLRSMASHRLVSGLPRVFPSLPPSSAPPCTPCVAGWHLTILDVPESPQQNGVAERCIRLVMDIARTSMIHARAPHFLWPYAVRYTTHQLNLQPRVSRPEASLTSLWTGSPGVGSAFLDTPDYAFYHPPLHQFLESRDVRFHKSVFYYARYPCGSLPVPPPPLFLAPSPPPAPAPSVPPPPPGPAPSGVPNATHLPSVVRQVASPSPQSSSQFPQQPSALLRQVTVDSWGVGAGGAATGGTRFGGALLRGAGAGGAGTGGASSGGAGVGGAGAGGASSRGARAGGAGAGGASFGGAGAGGAGTGGASSGGAGAGGASSGGAGVGGAGTGGASPGGAGAGGAGTGGASFEETGAGGTTTAPPHRHDSRLQGARRLSGLRALGLPSAPPVHSQSPTAYGPFPPPDSAPVVFSPPQSQSPPSVLTHDRTTRCPLRARPSSPFDDLRTVLFRSSPRRAPPVSVLPPPPASSLTISSHPITDYYHAARPVVSRVLASLVTDPRASSSSVSALTAAVIDFASTRRLDFATRQFELEFLAAASPSLCAMLLSPEGDTDALDIPTPRTYRTYVDVVPPPRANVVDGMWIFKVNRRPGSPRVIKARYMARGFSQCEGVDFFHNFAPTPKMTTLRVLLHVAAQRDYELHSLDFSTMFLQGHLHEEIWLRRPLGFTDTFPPRTQWSLRRPVYGLCQSPREWHDTIRSMLCDFGFRPSSSDPSLFVRAGSTPFSILVYVDDLVFATADRAAVAKVLWRFEFQFSTTQPTPLAVDHKLTDPFPDEPFESSGPYTEFSGCLMDSAICDSSYAEDAETQRSTQGYCFILGARAVLWRSTRSSSVPSSSAEVEIYAGAMAAQELRWLTFLLADLVERPGSAPTLYADNKTMILLCREP